MKKSRPVIRPAITGDFQKFYPDVPSPSMRAWVAEKDGDLIGIAGIVRVDGTWWLVCDVNEEMRKFPITILRTSKHVMKTVREQGVRQVFAQQDPREPKSGKWLASLGFKPVDGADYIWKWRL